MEWLAQLNPSSSILSHLQETAKNTSLPSLFDPRAVREWAVRAWFDTHLIMMSLFLAPYSSFLNPIEEFFMSLEMEGFWPCPQGQRSLQEAMNAECQDITAEQYQEWKGISKDSSQDALPENISGVMWMRTCGQTQKIGQIKLHTFVFFCGFFCLYMHIINYSYIAYFLFSWIIVILFFYCPVANKAFTMQQLCIPPPQLNFSIEVLLQNKLNTCIY